MEEHFSNCIMDSDNDPIFPKLSNYITFEATYLNRDTREFEKKIIVGKIDKLNFSSKDEIAWLDIKTQNKYDNFAIMIKNTTPLTINRTFIKEWQFCTKKGNKLN